MAPLESAAGWRLRAEPLVVAAAIPFVFLHPYWQPSVAVGPVDVTLTDLAILAASLAGVTAGVRAGWAPLRVGLALWAPLVAFCVWLLASIAWGYSADPDYGLGSHAISALKFVEYAVLAPVVPLTMRSRGDRRMLLWAFALWSAFLSLIAVLQFLGLVAEFHGRRPLQREPSFVGIHDLGAISGATLALAFVAIACGRRGRLPLVGGIAGAFGVAIAAANDAVVGMCLSVVAVWALAARRGPVGLRRVAGMVVVAAIVGLGANSLRASTVDAFLQFLGVSARKQETGEHIQSYSQRVVLSYIGLEIWLRHPVVGAGWQESQHPHAFEPVLERARRRFPDVAAQSFPARNRLWGVQNGVVQTLADLGIVGFVLAVWTFLVGLARAVRVALRAPPPLAREGILVVAWLIVGLLVFTFTGLLAGVAVNALLWIALGQTVALTAAARTADAAG